MYIDCTVGIFYYLCCWLVTHKIHVSQHIHDVFLYLCMCLLVHISLFLDGCEPEMTVNLPFNNNTEIPFILKWPETDIGQTINIK